eukprot:TRINITY_DN3710_c0_g1_i1.p1 TRINITY_DN3710_c0_g1~~TRINITY_DN3710_c0_g1_i1.p1  ORF type:complete len:1100 (+),score=200.45 TRINITY_DN3710_c0_g1_i1:191-3490(+)
MRPTFGGFLPFVIGAVCILLQTYHVEADVAPYTKNARTSKYGQLSASQGVVVSKQVFNLITDASKHAASTGSFDKFLDNHPHHAAFLGQYHDPDKVVVLVVLVVIATVVPAGVVCFLLWRLLQRLRGGGPQRKDIRLHEPITGEVAVPERSLVQGGAAEDNLRMATVHVSTLVSERECVAFVQTIKDDLARALGVSDPDALTDVRVVQDTVVVEFIYEDGAVPPRGVLASRLQNGGLSTPELHVTQLELVEPGSPSQGMSDTSERQRSSSVQEPRIKQLPSKLATAPRMPSPAISPETAERPPPAPTETIQIGSEESLLQELRAALHPKPVVCTKVMAHLKNLSRSLSEAQKEQSTLRDQVRIQKEQVVEAQREQSTLRDQVRIQQEQVAQAQREQDTLRDTVRVQKEQVEKEMAALRLSVRERSEQAVKAAAEAQSEHSALRDKLLTQTQEAQRVQSDLRGHVRSQEEQVAEAQRVQSDLHDHVRGHEEQVAEAERVQSDLRGRLRSQEEQLAEAQRVQCDLRGRVRSQEEQVAEARSEHSALRDHLRIQTEETRVEQSALRDQFRIQTEEAHHELSALRDQVRVQTEEVQIALRDQLRIQTEEAHNEHSDLRDQLRTRMEEAHNEQSALRDKLLIQTEEVHDVLCDQIRIQNEEALREQSALRDLMRIQKEQADREATSLRENLLVRSEQVAKADNEVSALRESLRFQSEQAVEAAAEAQSEHVALRNNFRIQTEEAYNDHSALRDHLKSRTDEVQNEHSAILDQLRRTTEEAQSEHSALRDRLRTQTEEAKLEQIYASEKLRVQMAEAKLEQDNASEKLRAQMAEAADLRQGLASCESELEVCKREFQTELAASKREAVVCKEELRTFKALMEISRGTWCRSSVLLLLMFLCLAMLDRKMIMSTLPGGSDLLDPEPYELPSSVLDEVLGVHAVRWIRFAPVKVRYPNATAVQLADISFRHSAPSMLTVTGASERGSSTVCSRSCDGELDLAFARAWSSTGEVSDGQEGANAIDGDNETMWIDLVMNPLTIELPSTFVVSEFQFTTAASDEGNDPVQWSLSGSSDGTTWVVLHSQVSDFDTPTERQTPTGWIKMQSP